MGVWGNGRIGKITGATFRPYAHAPTRVRLSSRPQRRRLASVVVGLGLCLASLLVYMWPRLYVIRLGYRVQMSEQRLRELLQEQDQLRLDIAALKDPQRLYRVAIEQLGMSVPRHDQVFTITRERRSQ